MKNKLLLGLMSATFLLVASMSTINAQTSPIYIFVNSESKTIVKDNPFAIDLHVNTMGNKIKKISTRIVIEGQFNNPPAFSYNKHSNLSTLPLISSIDLVNFSQTETPNKVYADVSFDSVAPKYFNEGSSDISLYQIRGSISQSSNVIAYIDPDYTSIEVDGQQPLINISTIATNPLKLSVDSTASEELKLVSEKISQVSEDVSELKNQVNTQKDQLNIIQTLLEKISLFFQKFFSRFEN